MTTGWCASWASRRSEFELIPHLLRRPSTLRLIDELFIECHHKETWSNGPHRRSECVQMARNLQAAGVWTHEWRVVLKLAACYYILV